MVSAEPVLNPGKMGPHPADDQHHPDKSEQDLANPAEPPPGRIDPVSDRFRQLLDSLVNRGQEKEDRPDDRQPREPVQKSRDPTNGENEHRESRRRKKN